MNHPQITSAHGLGLATLTHAGSALDTWFPHPALDLPPDAEAGTVRVEPDEVPEELAALGIPALNFGPGDPNLAHTRDEHVRTDQITACTELLRRYLVSE